MSKWARGKMLIGLALVVAVSACAPDVRYRVLTFFFDGVPEPGAKSAHGYPIEDGNLPGPSDDGAASGPSARVVYYSHPPYRENRCSSCHNSDDGQVLRSPEEGLCLACHGELVQKPAFLHGPVAVNACSFCHHHHVSTYPNLLLDDPIDICFRCHDEDDLTTGPHHQGRDTQPNSASSAGPCLQCHDPHGGDDRFFLKPGKS